MSVRLTVGVNAIPLTSCDLERLPPGSTLLTLLASRSITCLLLHCRESSRVTAASCSDTANRSMGAALNFTQRAAVGLGTQGHFVMRAAGTGGRQLSLQHDDVTQSIMSQAGDGARRA